MKNIIEMLKDGYCLTNDRADLQDRLIYDRGIDREEAEELLEELEDRLLWEE
jgi:hypothetical protein